MKFYLSIIILLALSACATNGELTDKEKWEQLEGKSGAKTVSTKNRDGSITEFVFRQETDYDLNVIQTHSEMARACEDYARKTPAMRDWLQTVSLYTSPSPRDRTRSRMPSSA